MDSHNNHIHIFMPTFISNNIDASLFSPLRSFAPLRRLCFRQTTQFSFVDQSDTKDFRWLAGSDFGSKDNKKKRRMIVQSVIYISIFYR